MGGWAATRRPFFFLTGRGGIHLAGERCRPRPAPLGQGFDRPEWIATFCLPHEESDLIVVEVAQVTFSAPHGGYVVVLRVPGADRWLPIFIGSGEAQAIARNLRGDAYPRPMTFDLIAGLLEALDGEVLDVAITRLHENTFFAEIVLKRPGGEVLRLDARPSDAIPLALRLGLAIHVDEAVMDTAGHDGFPRMISLQNQIDELEGELAEAVEREDFEKAARLRDQIRYYRKLAKADEEEEDR